MISFCFVLFSSHFVAGRGIQSPCCGVDSQRHRRVQRNSKAPERGDLWQVPAGYLYQKEALCRTRRQPQSRPDSLQENPVSQPSDQWEGHLASSNKDRQHLHERFDTTLCHRRDSCYWKHEVAMTLDPSPREALGLDWPLTFFSPPCQWSMLIAFYMCAWIPQKLQSRVTIASLQRYKDEWHFCYQKMLEQATSSAFICPDCFSLLPMCHMASRMNHTCFW